MNDLVSVKTSCIFLLIRGRVIKTKQNFWWNEKFLRVEKPTSGGSEGLIGLKWINELWWKHILDCSVPLKGWPSTPHETIESAAQNSTRFWKNVFDCWYRTHSICCQSKKKKKKKDGISRPWSDARRRWFNASNHYSEDPWIQPWGLFWILSTNVWRTVKKKCFFLLFGEKVCCCVFIECCAHRYTRVFKSTPQQVCLQTDPNGLVCLSVLLRHLRLAHMRRRDRRGATKQWGSNSSLSTRRPTAPV